MKLFLRYLGYILIISAMFTLLPITVGIFYQESIISFVISALISIILALILYYTSKSIKTQESSLSLTSGLSLVATAFMVIPVIGAISFLKSFNYNLLNAFFESVSGYTTTGFTLYSTLEGLPKSLLIWRAETQWMGGIGIIIVFLFIFSRLRAHTLRPLEEQKSVKSSLALYQAQGFSDKFAAGIKGTTTNILLIYVGYTVLGIILLFLTGMPLLESIGMSFTSISTGGFTLSDTFYQNNLQLGILSLLMIFGSISFITHNKLIRFKIKEFIIDTRFLLITAAAALLVYISTKDIGTALFETISAFTTTGYTLSEVSLLPQLFISVIVIGMVIGGNVGSTAGGIKIFRIHVLTKSIPWTIKKLLSPPHAIIPFKINKKPVEEKELLIVHTFIFTYMLILVFASLSFMLLGYSFLDSTFQVVSALGTVGMQSMQLAGLHWLGKSILIVCMILGRLEIFPLFVLIGKLFKR
ncbi:MAG: hypothetical protein KJ601_04140 [Nanoarchaeota archaeon]|nr:hypothetical protein [Nanoarchaeota archaeon]